MAKPILTDELWAAIEPLLPVHVPSPNGDHPRVSDRTALTGILYVLHTGIPWEYLPVVGVSEFLCKRFGLQWMEMRSPNSMVKRVSAAFQSRMGMVHFWLMLRSTR